MDVALILFIVSTIAFGLYAVLPLLVNPLDTRIAALALGSGGALMAAGLACWVADIKP